MTERTRACTLAFAEPSRVIFGVRYGVCPLNVECPDNIVCGHTYTQQIIATMRGDGEQRTVAKDTK